MGVTNVRILTIAGVAALLTLSTAVPAATCSGPSLNTAQAQTIKLAAATKKPMHKKEKEKVEYMRPAS
jgi:hypothetical protein